MRTRTPLLLSVLLLAACGDDGDGGSPDVGVDVASDVAVDAAQDSGADALADATADVTDTGGGPIGVDPAQAGPWAVGYQRLDADGADARSLSVGVWYPSSDDASDTALSALVQSERSAELAALLADAPEGCPTQSVSVAMNGSAAEGTWPVVVYSHCHECLGVSGASVAARLASWGFVVLTPDHTNNTLWNGQADDGAELNTAFLEVRGGDVTGLLDQLESGDTFADIRGMVDLDRVAIAGHSFGAVTTGWVAERDARVDAAVAIAAPVENPLIAGVTAANIDVPMLFIVATEDNSISEFGNIQLRNNYAAVAGPAYKAEFVDAGHWSVSDLCGLVEAFMPGCGDDDRQTNGSDFTYPDPDRMRDLTAAWVTGFIAAELLGDDMASAWLSDQVDTAEVTVEWRNVDE